MIRIATEKDIPAMLAIYRPYVEDTTVSFEYDVPCTRTFTQRFYDHIAQFPWLVWEEDGQVLGYAYAGELRERAAYRWCAEVSVYVSPGYHGKGIGRALYERLEEVLKKQGYRMTYAVVTGENTGSVTFHERVGYRKIAVFSGCGFKHGRWLDVIWLEKELKGEYLPNSFPKKWIECI